MCWAWRANRRRPRKFCSPGYFARRAHRRAPARRAYQQRRLGRIGTDCQSKRRACHGGGHAAPPFLNARGGGGWRRTGAVDTNARVNPPLRTPSDVDACIAGLVDGTIDCVATDHAPHALTDKLCEFDKAAPGISGIETALAVALTLVHQGRLDLALALRRMSFDAVRAFRLDRGELQNLGSLSAGAPGDLVLIDPDREWTVDPGDIRLAGEEFPVRRYEVDRSSDRHHRGWRGGLRRQIPFPPGSQ